MGGRGKKRDGEVTKGNRMASRGKGELKGHSKGRLVKGTRGHFKVSQDGGSER